MWIRKLKYLSLTITTTLLNSQKNYLAHQKKEATQTTFWRKQILRIIFFCCAIQYSCYAGSAVTTNALDFTGLSISLGAFPVASNDTYNYYFLNNPVEHAKHRGASTGYGLQPLIEYAWPFGQGQKFRVGVSLYSHILFVSKTVGFNHIQGPPSIDDFTITSSVDPSIGAAIKLGYMPVKHSLLFLFIGGQTARATTTITNGLLAPYSASKQVWSSVLGLGLAVQLKTHWQLGLTGQYVNYNQFSFTVPRTTTSGSTVYDPASMDTNRVLFVFSIGYVF